MEMAHGDEKVKEEMVNCLVTGMLHLSHATLLKFPQIILTESMEKITRLDISFNNISVIPPEITVLTNLREFWMHNNPIKEVPSVISNCSKLEVIDIRNTKVDKLPPSIALLKRLVVLDWKRTPLEKILWNENEVAVNDLQGLKKIYQTIHERDAQKELLYEMFTGVHFLNEADRPNIKSVIHYLVEDLSDMFTNLEDFTLFVRRANTLIPNKIDQINPQRLIQAKKEFHIMKDNTKRKRLAADVEIKLRNIYFDRVERTAVEHIINSIYEHVLPLEDIQFFVQYASKVLPNNPNDATGELIWDNILELQAELIAKREASINSLFSCLCQMYPEQTQLVLREKASEISSLFQKERFATKRELNSISQIIADSSKIFPPDFVSLVPADILANAQALFKRTTAMA